MSNIIYGKLNTGATVPFMASVTAKGRPVFSVLAKKQDGSYYYHAAGRSMKLSALGVNDVADLKSIEVGGVTFPLVASLTGNEESEKRNPKQHVDRESAKVISINGKRHTVYFQVSNPSTGNCQVLGTIAPEVAPKAKAPKVKRDRFDTSW